MNHSGSLTKLKLLQSIPDGAAVNKTITSSPLYLDRGTVSVITDLLGNVAVELTYRMVVQSK